MRAVVIHMKIFYTISIIILLSGCASDKLIKIDDSDAIMKSKTLKYIADKEVLNVELRDADFYSTLSYLRKLTDDNIGFVYRPEPADVEKNEEMKLLLKKRINIIYDKILLSDLIRIISLYFNIDYRIDTGYVLFGPPIELCGGIETRCFKIPKSQIKNISALKKTLPKDAREAAIAYDEENELLYIQTERRDLFWVIETWMKATQEKEK